MKDTIDRHFTQGQIEILAKILGDTAAGLTGNDIGNFLASCKIEDTDPGITKWKRLYNAFVNAHNKSGRDNYLLKFITKALEPVRFINNKARFDSLVEQINNVLIFQGLEYRDDNKFHNIEKARNLTEANNRVNSLKRIITERNYHSALLEYCREELLVKDYFHAVQEAVKGIADTIRRKTGLTTDGADLIDCVFNIKAPLLLINELRLETEISEQKGFCNLLKGLFGTFRNPTAHAAKIYWAMNEQDAFDLFAMASYAFRRIENARINKLEL
jgi:uncharacterized protein (TIGR02391 family)